MTDVFYKKNEHGQYIPISINQICVKDWEDKLIIIRVGSDELPATQEELDSTTESIDSADALDSLENTSFLVTQYNVEIDVVGSIKEIGEKYVTVLIKENDSISDLIPGMQKKVREMLKGVAKKVILLPTPLSVNEYKEVMEIKRRCDMRRERRGS